MGRSRRKEPEPPEPEIYVPYDIADLPATNKRPNRAGTSQGNPLGVINGCGGRGQPADLDDDRAADFGGGFDDPFLPPAQDRAKRKDKEKLDQNWRAAAPALRGHYISLAPLYAQWQDEESLLKEQALNKRIESALHFHTSKCALCSEEARAREPEVVGRHPAHFVGFGMYIPLSLPIWGCPGCKEFILPQATQIGCFGNRPIRPSFLFDLSLMHQYAVLFRHGGSCAGFVESVNASIKWSGRHNLREFVGVDRDDFTAAYYEFRRVTHQLTCLTGLGVKIDSSPLAVCPICSPRPEGDPYKVSIAMDAVNKCGHLAHAGNEVQLEPRVHHFFGKGEQEMTVLEKKGYLNNIQAYKQYMLATNSADAASSVHEDGEAEVLLKHIVKDCPSIKTSGVQDPQHTCSLPYLSSRWHPYMNKKHPPGRWRSCCPPARRECGRPLGLERDHLPLLHDSVPALNDQRLALVFGAMTPAAINALAVRGFDPVFGGRPVKRVIQRELETPLARALLGAEFQEEDAIVVGLDALEHLTFVRVPQGATHAGTKALEAAMATACAGQEGVQMEGKGDKTQGKDEANGSSKPAHQKGGGKGGHKGKQGAVGREVKAESGEAGSNGEAAGNDGGAKAPATAQAIPNMGARPLKFDPLKKISTMASNGEDITKDGHAARADQDSLPTSSG